MEYKPESPTYLPSYLCNFSHFPFSVALLVVVVVVVVVEYDCVRDSVCVCSRRREGCGW